MTDGSKEFSKMETKKDKREKNPKRDRDGIKKRQNRTDTKRWSQRFLDGQ